MFEKLVVNYVPRFAEWILIVLGLCLLFTYLTGCVSYDDPWYETKMREQRHEILELKAKDNDRFYEVLFCVNGKWVPVFSGVYQTVTVTPYMYSETKTLVTIKTFPDEWLITIPMFDGFDKVKVIRHYRFTGGNETKIINMKDEKK